MSSKVLLERPVRSNSLDKVRLETCANGSKRKLCKVNIIKEQKESSQDHGHGSVENKKIKRMKLSPKKHLITLEKSLFYKKVWWASQPVRGAKVPVGGRVGDNVRGPRKQASVPSWYDRAPAWWKIIHDVDL